MVIEITRNIDTIIVNPSEEEKVKAAFLVNGLGKFVNMIVPHASAAKGQILACDRGRLTYLRFETEDILEAKCHRV